MSLSLSLSPLLSFSIPADFERNGSDVCRQWIGGEGGEEEIRSFGSPLGKRSERARAAIGSLPPPLCQYRFRSFRPWNLSAEFILRPPPTDRPTVDTPSTLFLSQLLPPSRARTRSRPFLPPSPPSSLSGKANRASSVI